MSEGFLTLPKDTPVVGVRTTSGRGFTTEELAEQAADRIISISSTAPEAIQAQARAFRSLIVSLLKAYMDQAVLSDRTTVYNALSDAGHKDLAELVRGL